MIGAQEWDCIKPEKSLDKLVEYYLARITAPIYKTDK